MKAREKLIVALDVPSAAAGAQLAEKLRGHAGLFKVGLENFVAEGPTLARFLAATGVPVFLDLKFHDIPNTVRGAAREAAALGVRMLNVHASGGRQMMEAALEGAHGGAAAAGNPSPLVLGVTVLTSLSPAALAETGMSGTPEESVVRLAELARAAGLDGVVASPAEITALRRALGPDFVIVTPGIRPAAADAADQVRVATPEAAVRAGADYLVVGRPITAAPDPVAAADEIVREIERGLASR